MTTGAQESTTDALLHAVVPAGGRVTGVAVGDVPGGR